MARHLLVGGERRDRVGLTDEQCRDFDARLILLLVNHIGDEAVIREALKEAAAK